ncbi:hypothetical protein [Pectobacterium betavasculorum]|uniref:Uncharacterized protein n=1 Tax=Pectobacterium betavasculorum TaxID=55207 RepID=A0ABR4V3S5_9GAMM|nr:hypothetical protein [Pectobacterium betavasculorum]KFX22160.1 hypothetical protein JV35_03085 [Pectobacterium betavasculorum]
MLRYDFGSRLESVQEARFVGGIDDREEVNEHERRGRDTELAVKRKFLVQRFEWFYGGHGGAPVYCEIELG